MSEPNQTPFSQDALAAALAEHPKTDIVIVVSEDWVKAVNALHALGRVPAMRLITHEENSHSWAVVESGQAGEHWYGTALGPVWAKSP